MNSLSGDQLELIETARPQHRSRESGQVGIVLDQNAFLAFLSGEWLHPEHEGSLLLGTERACVAGRSGNVAVAVWFAVRDLPDLTVMAWGHGGWRETTLQGLQRTDSIVACGGPLPLFAVDHFEVGSETVMTRLMALARNFDDVAIPSQPMKVSTAAYVESPGPPPPDVGAWRPPQNWDALRGAATMAAFAVPAIDPWIELFCMTLRAGDEASAQASVLSAPWWKTALWNSGADGRDDRPELWQAMVAEFSESGRLRAWRAKDILESIGSRARLLGAKESLLEDLRHGALALLDDRATVEKLDAHGDFLVLTLQLLLLRPSPEKFLGWREDWPAIPPAVWWTGMTLAGYLQGFQALPRQFRGSAESRRLLALKTWQLACDGDAGPWHSLTPERMSWSVIDDTVALDADGQRWAEHKLGTRGHWYRANFADPVVLAEAERLAGTACPESLQQMLVLSDVDLPLGGDGTVKVDSKRRLLKIDGQVQLPMAHGVSIEKRLDIAGFRQWLATASMSQRIGRPPPVGTHVEVTKPARRPSRQTRAALADVTAPLGLQVLPDFISEREEATLIATINSLAWDTSMKRRVQHFGWRYDYRARKVDPASYLGALPDWAGVLAERLLELGVVSELPDQVIVNSYDRKQGISRHIDCPSCFRGPVATISLLETWDMVFTREQADGERRRFVQALPRRSATVLDGEARSLWFHEIPERLTEHGVPRVRRLSITFRKVAA